MYTHTHTHTHTQTYIHVTKVRKVVLLQKPTVVPTIKKFTMISYVLYAPPISFSLVLTITIIFFLWVQIMNLPVMQFSPSPCHCHVFSSFALSSDIKACLLPSAGGTTANPYILTRDKYKQKYTDSVKK